MLGYAERHRLRPLTGVNRRNKYKPSFTNDESTLVQGMAWCRQAANHYLSQLTWANVDPDLYHRMASLGQNELNM